MAEARFDELIHPSTRLSIVSILACTDWVDFSFLRDRLKLSAAVHAERRHVSGAPGIEHVDRAAPLRDRYRLAASRRLFIGDEQVVALHSEDRDVAAARIRRKQQSVIGAQRQGALRFQGIIYAAAAAAQCIEAVLLEIAPVVPALKGNHLIPLGVVGHHEYSLLPPRRRRARNHGYANTQGNHRRQKTTLQIHHRKLLHGSELRRHANSQGFIVTRDHWSGAPAKSYVEIFATQPTAVRFLAATSA